MKESDEKYTWLEIPANTNYWLVRATGGKYYSDFLETSTISILNNKVSVEDINNSLDGNKTPPINGDVHALFAYAYSHKNKHWVTNAARQADIFVNGMQNGDLVLVPSKSSNRFALGVIAGRAYDEDADKLRDRIHYAPLNGIGFSVSDAIKRRPVIWMKEISREEFPPKLAWILTAHQTILSINNDSHLINNLISPLYVYRSMIHLNVFSSQRDGLTIADWASLSDFIKKSAKDPEAQFEINMGADIHSPGFIELVTNFQNYEYIFNIVKALWNSTANSSLNYPIGIYMVLRLIMGKEGRKQGLLKWLLSVANSSEDLYQKHFTNKNIRKLAKINDENSNLHLKIRDAGTSIELQNQKKNLDNQESQHERKE